MPRFKKEEKAECAQVKETPEQKKRREKEEKRKASLEDALKSYKEWNPEIKSTMTKIWLQRFKEEFSVDKQFISSLQIESLIEEYWEKNMQTIFDTIKTLYWDILNRKDWAYYYFKDITNSCLWLSQQQINLITPEVLEKRKEIINNQKEKFDINYKDNIIALKTFFTMWDTLYSVAVKKDSNRKEKIDKDDNKESKNW